jgi:hypothetical protein
MMKDDEQQKDEVFNKEWQKDNKQFNMGIKKAH